MARESILEYAQDFQEKVSTALAQPLERITSFAYKLRENLTIPHNWQVPIGMVKGVGCLFVGGILFEHGFHQANLLEATVGVLSTFVSGYYFGKTAGFIEWKL